MRQSFFGLICLFFAWTKGGKGVVWSISFFSYIWTNSVVADIGSAAFFLCLDQILGSRYLVHFELSFVWTQLFAFFFWSIVDFCQIGPKCCLFGLGPILFFIIWTKQAPGDPRLYCKTGTNTKQAYIQNRNKHKTGIKNTPKRSRTAISGSGGLRSIH